MLDPEMIKLLYANETLEEITARAKQGGAPLRGVWATLEHARELFERGAVQEACDTLADLTSNAPESRMKLWAAKALRDQGLMPGGPSAVSAQGVVMEVPMEESKDVLAVYRDGTARFFSYAGSAAVYEAHDQKCDQLCRQIIAAADQIVAAPKGAAFPDDGNYPRITVLTLSGEAIAGTASPINSLLLLGAQLIGRLAEMRDEYPPV